MVHSQKDLENAKLPLKFYWENLQKKICHL